MIDRKVMNERIRQFKEAAALADSALQALHAVGIAPNALAMIIAAVSLARSKEHGGDKLTRGDWLALCGHVFDTMTFAIAARSRV